MTFRRTYSGLSSEHLFYRVDFVVYCEGRPPSNGDDTSLDALFWQRAFDAYSQKAVYCKTHGSKNDLQKIAEHLISEKINNIIVAMDRDYDDLFSCMKIHNRIIYTYGYSWESDAIVAFDFERVFTLFAASPNVAEVKREYVQFRNSITTKLYRCFVLDVKYYLSDTSLFNRQKPQSIICYSRHVPPAVDVARILNSARRCRNADLSSLDRTVLRACHAWCRFHGKTVARIIYQWFMFRAAAFRTYERVSMAVFMAAVINSLMWGSYRQFPALGHLRAAILTATG